MRFALLGADAESQAVADAAVAAGHPVVWPAPSTLDPNVAWEDLFDSDAADAIIVGAGGASADLRARQVQELAKQGRPLLVGHPLLPSVISYFEIDMARTESGAVVRHFNQLLESLRFVDQSVFSQAAASKLGAVEQITATRALGDRSRDAVLWHFARDVEALAHLAGRFDRIGAHAAMGDSDAAYASLSVQLSGPRQIPVRWSVEPLGHGAALTVTMIFEHGRAAFIFDASGAITDFSEQGILDHSEIRAASSPALAHSAVTQFVDAVETESSDASTWPAALDAMELADTIEISLRRGRMIDVHHRELTETLAFKGMMSAVGCGLLVVLVPLMLVVGWIAGVLGIPMSHYWPHLLLVFLAAFLALQFVPKLMSPRAGPTAGGVAGAVPPADSAD